MKRKIVTIVLQAVVIAAGGQSGMDYGKMSMYVRQAASVSSGAKSLLPVGGGGRRMCVFVRADPSRADSVFVSNGCRVLDERGDIFIADVPLSRLRSVASSDAVARIEASRPCRLAMDTTAIVTDALPVYSGDALPQAYTGSGVVVGVMDVGFDLTHPNFYDRSMADYRIKAFWDQLSTDTVGSGMPVGRDYTGREAILARRHSADGHIQTHGTHTLGIAAGSGFDTSYRGMAYDSELCLVSNAVSSDIHLIDPDDLYKYTTAVDALGFKYIFDYAGSRGLPCVASFSEGSFAELGDDDRLYCEYLGRLTGPGRIIVASAGNESVAPRYIPKPAGEAEAGSFVWSTEADADIFVQSDTPFTMRFLAYGQSVDTLTVCSSDGRMDSVAVFPLRLSDGSLHSTVSVSRYPSDFPGVGTVWHVTVSAAASLSSLAPLAVVAEGADADVSLRCSSPAMFYNGLADTRWSAAETSHNVLVPGAFPGVITVGSTIHRTGFVNYLGQYRDYSQPGRNDGVRSYYSSVGPAMDGTLKPDVMAPGDNVVSSYSSFYIEHNPDARDIDSDVAHFYHNGRMYAWNSNTGTSMAAPVVAGAVALWLQARPDLTPAGVLDIISYTSRHPDSSLDYPNNYYGHGEIDVYRGLLHLLGIDAVDELSMEMPEKVRAAVTAGGQLVLRFASVPSSSFSVSVFAVSGKKVLCRNFGSLQGTDAMLDVSSLSGGVYAVQISGKEPGVTGSVLVRR